MLLIVETPDDERLDVLGTLMASMIRDAGKKREDVATSLEIAPRTLGRWLAGEYRPSRPKLLEFAKLMDCDDLEILNELLRAAGHLQIKDHDGHMKWSASKYVALAQAMTRSAKPSSRARSQSEIEESPTRSVGPVLLRDIMTPASEIVWISTKQTAQDAAWLMLTAKHRRLLVYDEDHKPCGFVPAVRILDALKQRCPEAPVVDLMKALSPFVETQPVADVSLAMSQNDISIAAVIDKRGVLVGIVTTKNFSDPWRPTASN